jgi:hypothetical protein
MKGMLTRFLAVATALLAVLVIHQYTTIGELRGQVTAAETRATAQARSAVADSMEGQGPEIQRAMTWLNDFYKSPDGLQRPEGLWIHDHPDYEGLSVWIFDVYLRRRLKGDTEEQARQAIETTVKQSDEWRAKHRAG